MPVPEGIISTSTGPVDPEAVEFAEAVLKLDDENLVEAIDAEEAQDIADFDAAVAELEEEQLPEAEADDL